MKVNPTNTSKVRYLATLLLILMSVASISAQPLAPRLRRDHFTCSLGTFKAQRTTAKNIDSQIQYLIPTYNTRPHSNYGSYEKFIKYRFYISSNNIWDNDVEIREVTTNSLEIQLNDGRRQYQYRGFLPIVRVDRVHVGNGWFGDKMYLIVTRQYGDRPFKSDRIRWHSETQVLVDEFDLIDRAYDDPSIQVIQAPPSPGQWTYQFRTPNSGTVRTGARHNWRMRLVRRNGSSTTLASGSTFDNATVQGTVNINPSLATPGFPSDFIYFELLPSTDSDRTNNTVKTPFIF